MKQTKAYVVLSALLLTGCPSSPSRFDVEPAKVSTVADLGTVRLSVVSIAPWEKYKDTLKTKFNLTADAALTDAITDSRIIQELKSSGSKIDLKTGLSSDTQTTSVENGESTETSNQSSGTLENISDPSLPQAPSKDNLPGTAQETPIELGDINSRTKYQSALDLYQEVKLLEQYVEDIEKRTDYQTYILRLQATLIPNMRLQPYDAYVNLNIFNDHQKDKLPVVVPILASNSLESSLTGAELNHTMELGLAISALRKTAYDLNVGAFNKSIEAALGRDLNNIFTVGLLAQNSVRVRFGALQQVRTDYAMIPRSEYVTLLVMIPKTEKKKREQFLDIHSYFEFRHVISGKILENTKPGTTKEVAKKISQDFGLTGDANTIYDELWRKVAEGKWPEFSNAANSYCATTEQKADNQKSQNKECLTEYDLKVLWGYITYYNTYYGESLLKVAIPTPHPLTLPNNKTVFLRDNAKDSTTATITGGISLSEEKLCAMLLTEDASGGIEYAISPSQIATKNFGRSIELRFPSMKKWGLSQNFSKKAHIKLGKVKDDNCTLVTEKTECKPGNFCSKKILYRVEENSNSKGYTIAAQTGFITLKDSELVLNIIKDSDNPSTSISIALSNAGLTSVQNLTKGGANPVVNGTQFVLDLTPKPQKVQVKLKLSGLAKDEKVGITAIDNNKRKTELPPLKVREK